MPSHHTHSPKHNCNASFPQQSSPHRQPPHTLLRDRRTATCALCFVLAALYLLSTSPQSPQEPHWQGWIPVVTPFGSLQIRGVDIRSGLRSNSNDSDSNSNLNFNASLTSTSSFIKQESRVAKVKSGALDLAAKREDGAHQKGFAKKVSNSRGIGKGDRRQRREFKVSSCEEAGFVKGKGSGKRAAAVLVFSYQEFSTELYCAIFSWRSSFITMGMDALDFVLLIGRTKFSVAQVKELKEFGFVLVHAELPNVYDKVLYEERGKEPVEVDDARYSFLLKLFAMGLTNYEAVFIFDMDAQPGANLYGVKELAWLSPDLKGSEQGAPPTWELYYASEEDTAILGGYIVARTNASRCKSMLNTVLRPEPWSPGYGWAKKPANGDPFVSFPIWEGSICANRQECSSPTFTRLGPNASALCQSGQMLAGCLAETSDQGLFLQEYVLNNPHKSLYKSPTVVHYLFDGAYEGKMYHGYKAWELLDAEPVVQQLLETWGLRNEHCCACNSALVWWEQFRRAVLRHELPPACVALKHKYDGVLKSHLKSMYGTFVSTASQCVSNT